MKSLIEWLADVTLGPACGYGCGYRARGPRSLRDHVAIDHAGGL